MIKIGNSNGNILAELTPTEFTSLTSANHSSAKDGTEYDITTLISLMTEDLKGLQIKTEKLTAALANKTKEK